MDKNIFEQLIMTNIIPQFPITNIIDDEFSPTKKVATQPSRAGQIILAVKPSVESGFRMILKRSQGFDETERTYIQHFIQESEKIDSKGLNIEDHEIFIQNISIAKTVNADHYQSILAILEYYEMLRERTYEGSNVAYSCILDCDRVEESSRFNLKSLHEQDFLIVLSNGISTALELDANANVIGYLSITEASENDLFAPLIFKDICNMALEKKIGVVLTINGDILIFKNREMLFARRRGKWNIFSHRKTLKLIGKNWKPELKKAVYLSAIDVSFMHTGGLLYLSKSDNDSKVGELTFAADIFGQDENQISKKAALMGYLVGRKKFQELPRLIRKEISSIDGAILMTHDGVIRSIGAIITKTKQSKEGSRSAAAIGLSEFGYSIKISTDGAIKGYLNANSSDEFKPTFVVG